MAAPAFRGGDRLITRLREMTANAANATTLSVGFFSGSTESDGASTPVVAATLEFGGTLPARHVEAHTTEIFHLVNEKSGRFLRKGRFVKRSASNFQRTVDVPAHDIPAITIPPRPFFRRMISLGRKHWGEDLGKIMVAANYDAKLSLAQLGESMSGELVQSITDQVYAPLAKSTVAAKGFATTLIEHGDLKRAVGSQVE